jgi:hypothetical protein
VDRVAKREDGGWRGAKGAWRCEGKYAVDEKRGGFAGGLNGAIGRLGDLSSVPAQIVSRNDAGSAHKRPVNTFKQM